MNIRIYHFTDKDSDRARRLYNKLLKHRLYKSGGCFRTYWQDGTYSGQYSYESTVVVAWENRKPIGVAIIPRKEFFGYEDVRNAAGADGFLSGFVKEAYRHNGLGAILFNKVTKAAKAQRVFIADYVKHFIKDKKVKLIAI